MVTMGMDMVAMVPTGLGLPCGMLLLTARGPQSPSGGRLSQLNITPRAVVCTPLHLCGWQQYTHCSSGVGECR